MTAAASSIRRTACDPPPPLAASVLASAFAVFSWLIFGGEADELPNPDIDFKAFETQLTGILERNAKTWCPIRNREKEWVSINKLRRRYGKAGCVIS